MAEIVKLKEGCYGYKITKNGFTIVQDHVPGVPGYEPMTKKLATNIAYVVEKLMDKGEHPALNTEMIDSFKKGKPADDVIEDELKRRIQEQKEFELNKTK